MSVLFRTLSAVVVAVALTISLLGNTPSNAVDAPAEDEEPAAAANDLAEPSDLAEAFPTLFSSSGDTPTLGAVTADGDVPVLDTPGDVRISLNPADGVTLAGWNGATFNITSVGAAEPGIAGEHVVVYNTDVGSWAARPTSDAGVEIVESVPAGAADPVYQFELPSGTHLELLDNGDVAVVRDGAPPVPELAAAAAELTDAQDQVLEAAAADLEVAQDDQVAAENLDALATVTEEPAFTALAENETTAPGDEFTEAWLNPDAPLEDLQAAADALEEDLDPADYDPADLALVDAAADQVTQGQETAEYAEATGELASDAAGVAESNAMLDEELAVGDAAADADEMSAELDIADPDAELDRSAQALVEAQSEVGTNDRVEAVFSAPLSKAVESNTPVATALELRGPDQVAVVVPDVDETVVVDPFFIPVVLFVARIVIQRTAPIVIRAVADYARRQASAAAARVVAAQVRARASQAAVQAAARARAAEAARVLQLARIRAAQFAHAKKVQAAAQAQRLRDQGIQAQRLAATAARVVRERAANAAALARQKAQQAALAVVKKGQNVVKRAVGVSRDAVHTTIKALQVDVKNPLEAARLVQGFASRHPAVIRLLEEQVVSDGMDRLGVPDCFEAALIPSAPGGTAPEIISSLYHSRDVVTCLWESIENETAPEALSNTSAGYAAKVAYYDAQAEAETRARTFTNAPVGTPVGASVTSSAVPATVKSGDTTFLQVSSRNTGPGLPLDQTYLHLPGGLPYAQTGFIGTDTSRIRLTDENDDNVWSTGELVTAIASIKPPLMTPNTVPVSYGFITGTTTYSSGQTLTLNITGPDLPAVPGAVVGTSGLNGQGRVSWTAPANGGSAITRYEVQRNDTGEIRNAPTLPLTWTGLTNGVSYQFRVRACSAVGCGTWSAPVSVKPYTVPSTVGKPAVSSTNNALKLSWTAPATGGSAITRYELAGSGTASATGGTYTFALGQDGAQKSYQVRACNAAGCGAYSSASTATRAKVITVTKGAVAPYGYQYDTRVYGIPGAAMTLTCHDGYTTNWYSQKITLDSTGYYRDTTLCYSANKNPHWVTSGTLTSNKANF